MGYFLFPSTSFVDVTGIENCLEDRTAFRDVRNTKEERNGTVLLLNDLPRVAVMSTNRC
jgi:hypothetical protein